MCWAEDRADPQCVSGSPEADGLGQVGKWSGWENGVGQSS